MKKPRLLLIAIALVFFSMISCSPKYYTPSTQNVPLISSKGETNLSLAGNPDRMEVQGAYGVSDGVALKANAGILFPSDEDNNNGGSGKFIEGGVGYFTPVMDNWVFETYGVIGFGSFENHMPSTAKEDFSLKGDISGSLIEYGIQPNFGYKSKYFSAAISSRFILVNYSNVEGDLYFDNVDQVNYLKNHASNFMVEPALTLRGGLEKYKLHLQIAKSINITNPDFPQDDLLLSIGLNFNF